MKKLLIIMSALFITSLSAQSAESAIGTSQCEFSTANPVKTFEVKLDEGVELPDGTVFTANSVLYGKVTKVSDGQRGKRTGYFEFYLTKYITAEEEHDISRKFIKIKVSHYEPLDKKEVAKKVAVTGATTVASAITKVPGISQGISFVKGAAKAEEGENRLATGAKQVYKDSPLSYVEKGTSLVIHQGQQVKLKFTEDND